MRGKSATQFQTKRNLPIKNRLKASQVCKSVRLRKEIVLLTKKTLSLNILASLLQFDPTFFVKLPSKCTSESPNLFSSQKLLLLLCHCKGWCRTFGDPLFCTLSCLCFPIRRKVFLVCKQQIIKQEGGATILPNFLPHPCLSSGGGFHLIAGVVIEKHCKQAFLH